VADAAERPRGRRCCRGWVRCWPQAGPSGSDPPPEVAKGLELAAGRGEVEALGEADPPLLQRHQYDGPAGVEPEYERYGGDQLAVAGQVQGMGLSRDSLRVGGPSSGHKKARHCCDGPAVRMLSWSRTSPTGPSAKGNSRFGNSDTRWPGHAVRSTASSRNSWRDLTRREGDLGCERWSRGDAVGSVVNGSNASLT
jgi:hypothetical protein